jgi:hypothetical protein
MALFTADQADNSSIVRAERVDEDGVHKYWVFGIQDTDANYYDWTDNTLGASASSAEQRTAIYDFLTVNCEKIVPQPVITLATSDILGTVVGATS